MKKFLIATAALAITAGAAAAEVAVSGDGRMGFVYDGDDLNFSSRIRAKFTMSGESDSGLSFGGSIRADNAASGAKGSAGSVFVSGAFGKIEMGDVVGAAEAIHGDLPEIGFTDIAANDIGYITGDGAKTSDGNPVLLYTYSMDALDVAVSMNDGDKGTLSEYALGAGYKFGAARVGLGYEVAEKAVGPDDKLLSVSLSGEMAGVTGAVYFAKGSGGIKGVKEYGIGGVYTMDATTLKAMIRTVDTGTKVTYWGLGAEYDLGGGASIVGGVADNNMAGSDAVADLGLKFKF